MKAQWTRGPVELAMRYGEPSIESTLQRLAAQGIREVTLAPLYPQFADSTTTTVIEEVRRVVRERGLDMRLSTLPPFYDQPEYLDALVASAKPYLERDFDHLLLSFHGLPERHLHKLDPSGHCLKGEDCCRSAAPEVLANCYRAQCLRSAELFAQRMGLRPEQWSVSFQSRLGRAKWIEPYTEARLDELAAQGVKKLLVMCPAFVADCIETLEEIGDRGREQFREAGGEVMFHPTAEVVHLGHTSRASPLKVELSKGLGLALTGTDLYRDIGHDAQALQSLALARSLVVLQALGVKALPVEHQAKTRVIVQSTGTRQTLAKTTRHLRVVMVATCAQKKTP